MRNAYSDNYNTKEIKVDRNTQKDVLCSQIRAGTECHRVPSGDIP